MAWIFVVAVFHLIISLSIYILAEPGGIEGSRASEFAGYVLAVLCFPLVLLNHLDFLLPDRWRIPELAFQVAWVLSSLLWGIILVWAWNWWHKKKAVHV